MARQRELNLGFVSEHEKLRRNTNSFWGPEMAPFVYTSSRWGVESSREGLPDSNIGSLYQPPPTMDSSASGPRSRFGKKKDRYLSPISRTPSPPLLPTRKGPALPYGGFIGAERRRSRRQAARKGFFVRWRVHLSVNRGRQPILFVCPQRDQGVHLHWSMPTTTS